MVFTSGRRIVFCLIVCMLSACALQQPVITVTPPAVAGETGQTRYWWHVKYRIHWPENTEPNFYIDLLLADAVIEPILIQHLDSITYWRFHRRAEHDEAGHQFSFIFYADKTTARSIYQLVEHNDITEKMLKLNILEQILTDDPAKNNLTGLNATSDKNWPVKLQNAWPAYIMGVSSTWLQLIDQEIASDKMDNNITYLLEEYKKVDAKISKLWYEDGQHAFLHHLDAVFGYKPVLINKEPLQF